MAGLRRIIVRQGIVREFPKSGPRSFALRKWVTAVIVNSPEIRDAWTRSAPELAGRMHVLMNAVPLPAATRTELRDRLRHELSVDPDAILFGGAGNLFARKGFDLLIEAFAHAAIDGARLVIIGDGDELPALQALASRLGVSEKVSWLGRRDDAPALIGGLDAFVLSSHNEGMANVMLEAMAARCPVIAFDVSGVRTAIGPESGRSAAGRMVESASIDELSRAMRETAGAILSRDNALQAQVEEARWRIEHRFSEARMLDECEAILFRQ
jgi:glycosyltransferase involved in cell wall biosynthesis